MEEGEGKVPQSPQPLGKQADPHPKPILSLKPNPNLKQIRNQTERNARKNAIIQTECLVHYYMFKPVQNV